MKIIFLDIDGVLNHEYFYRGLSKYPRRKERYISEINRESVENLNLIIERTGASVVLSSSWRILHSIEDVQSYLNEQGFTGKIIDKTPRLNNKCSYRGNEIILWMQENEKLVGPYYNFNSYVILDDDSDMLYWQRKNFIHTDRTTGLTERDAKKAINILLGVRNRENKQETIEELRRTLKQIRSITNFKGCITSRIHKLANNALSL